jgi:redox-sensitive bicupin YhaK (pirin superfamily)
VPTYTPLLGAEILLSPGTDLVLDVDSAFEHGVLVDAGVLSVAGVETKQHDLAYVPPGSATLTLTSYDEPVRLLLLGGPPFGEAIVMWWNIVARTHEEVVEWRSSWQDQIIDGRLVDGWFGIPIGDERAPIPAPPLPNARLKERR